MTFEQYRQFDNAYSHPTLSGELPVVGTMWYQAAAYCNWLSEQEGISKEQWCYSPNKDGKYEDGMTLALNYLSLSGYRLPTEAETEYVTRAGATTARYFGETDELLSKYAWYLGNSQDHLWPVGNLKPNDLGFFDVQGNVSTWCQERFKPYPETTELSDDLEDELPIVPTDGRMIRGSTFDARPSALRSARRDFPVPFIQFNGYGFRVARTLNLPKLKAVYDAHTQLHASLALLPLDATQVDYLVGRLLNAEPHEVPVIRDALASHGDKLRDKLWAVVESPEMGRESQRLRAASALARYDPENEKWEKANALVVNDLISETSVNLGQWSETFRSVKNRLLPPLSKVFRDHQQGKAAERATVTTLLSDYAADQPQVLAELVMDADENQFALIYSKFEKQSEQGLPVLIAEIDRKVPSDATDDAKDNLAKRQANAAVGLLKLNHPEKVWPLLKHSPDPSVRSYLIHRLYLLGADPKTIIAHFDDEADLTIRRALLLSLGEYGETISPDIRKTLLAKVQGLYRTESDPGLHAASEWLLRQWREDVWLKQVNDEWAKEKEQREKRLDGINELLTNDKEKIPPQWYVNGQGQTMVVIPGPVEFMMGSPTTEVGRKDNEYQHKRRIGRNFALAATSVTSEQYRQFDKTYSHAAPSARSEELPVVGRTWYQAAAYCNWLSDHEGIPKEQWCFLPNMDDKYEDGMTLALNYLSLSGYRLPTEAEMEYATRAGAVTSRYFGESDELLPKYAWYQKNSQNQAWPVGSLKPNDLGLFDVQGNVFTWCQGGYNQYPETTGTSDDLEDRLALLPMRGRMIRGGGSFNFSLPSLLRSAKRDWPWPSFTTFGYGFRVAKSVTPRQ